MNNLARLLPKQVLLVTKMKRILSDWPQMAIILHVDLRIIVFMFTTKVKFILIIFLHHKKIFSGLERPLIKYRFEVQRTILPEHLSGSRPDEDSSEFLSAVAWRPRTNTLLAANSQGIIKLLTLK